MDLERQSRVNPRVSSSFAGRNYFPITDEGEGVTLRANSRFERVRSCLSACNEGIGNCLLGDHSRARATETFLFGMALISLSTLRLQIESSNPFLDKAILFTGGVLALLSIGPCISSLSRHTDVN